MSFFSDRNSILYSKTISQSISKLQPHLFKRMQIHYEIIHFLNISEGLSTSYLVPAIKLPFKYPNSNSYFLHGCLVVCKTKPVTKLSNCTKFVVNKEFISTMPRDGELLSEYISETRGNPPELGIRCEIEINGQTKEYTRVAFLPNVNGQKVRLKHDLIS